MPAPETPGKTDETLSDAELAGQLGADIMARLELHQKQLDHIDTMVHELVQFVDEHRPLLARFTRWAAAGKGWRAWQNGSSPKKSASG